MQIAAGIDASAGVLEIAERFLDGVRQAGPDNLMAFCPFHENVHTPAFTMSLTRGVYFCFSCHAKGTLWQFLSEMGEVDLRKRYGPLFEALDVAERPATATAGVEARKFLLRNDPLPEELLGLFEAVPTELEAEGFTEETLQYFDVGVDVVHNRYTFPLRDAQGTLVGISGRLPKGAEGPKYRVYDYEYTDFALSPREQLVKKELIWNFHRVRRQVMSGEATNVIIVEGFKAAMWVHQHGFPDVVALMGSFLSDAQAYLLEQLGVPLYVFLDLGEAGERGTDYAGDRLSRTTPVYVCPYPEHAPEKAQPTDLDETSLVHALTHAIPYITWYTQRKGIT